MIRILVAAGANPDRDDEVSGHKPLHEAARKNHFEAVAALIEAGVDPLTATTREDLRRCGYTSTTVGDTPLMYACESGHLEALDVFLPHIKDIDTIHQALAWAAARGRSSVVARILQHPGVDVNCKVRGDTPLFLACGNEDVDTMHNLLRAGADPRILCEGGPNLSSPTVNYNPYLGPSKSNPQWNCLYRFCELPSWVREYDLDYLQDILSLLIESGADVNQQCLGGSTPLHAANGSPILTRLLLASGANANAIDVNGNTPLHLTTSEDVIAALVEDGQADVTVKNEHGQTPLHKMIRSFDEKAAVKLMGYGIDCNAVDDHGNTALHSAFQTGPPRNSAILKALITGGTDPNLRNRDGNTALFCILGFDAREREAISSLIAAGADINAEDNNGQNVLFRHMANFSSEAFQYFVDFGASVSARDVKGRTIAHEVVRNWRMLEHVLEWRHLDWSAIDYDGNGLLHELALSSSNQDHSAREILLVWERLISLGLDVNQRNNAGRTPLHVLCMAHVMPQSLPQTYQTPVDLLISKCHNINDSDVDGNTPLHIAVTQGEVYTQKLLDAGADPTVCNYQGMTPLHLAARCRQSNVVGMLLDAIRKYYDMTAPGPVPGINAGLTLLRWKLIDLRDLTPLSYACQSGRPETVSLLLDAGADPTIGNLFGACAQFEHEDQCWKLPNKTYLCENDGIAVALGYDDTSRPHSAISDHGNSSLNHNSSVRLEEILDMLIRAGIDVSLINAIHNPGLNPIGIASRLDSLYALTCLVTVRDKYKTEIQDGSWNPGVAALFDEQMAVATREASVKMAREKCWKRGELVDVEIFQSIILRRQYHLVEEMLKDGARLLDKEHRCVDILIRHGLASLFDRVAEVETEARFEEGEWHAYGDETKPGLHFSPKDKEVDEEDTSHQKRTRQSEPPLFAGIARSLSNIEIIKLLVEKYGVDVDQILERNRQTYSALHYLANGRHWWQVAEALPYLIQAGANINARTPSGETPLHIALRGDHKSAGPFHKAAARVLVESGADVNAVDSSGRSCLSCAGYDVDLVKLLIKHGAVIVPDVIFSVIDSRSVSVLEALLNAEVDLNVCLPRPANCAMDDYRYSDIYMWFHSTGTMSYEILPLYYAALSKNFPSDPVQVQIVRMLLDHGADPYGAFLVPSSGNLGNEPEENDGGTEILVEDIPKGYEKKVVLHELFRSGKICDLLLNLPTLDVNYPDGAGRTLLHSICNPHNGPDYVIQSTTEQKTGEGKQESTAFQQLLSLGGDIRARDKHGKTVLHYMIGEIVANQLVRFEKSFAELLRLAPDLLDVADDDGWTPLHYAINRSSMRDCIEVARLLISSGANHLAVNHQGHNALHFLAPRLDQENIRILFEDLVRSGLDVNSRNSGGDTPLLVFARRHWVPHLFRRMGYVDDELWQKEAVATLKRTDADFSVRDANSRSVLHLAASRCPIVFRELMGMGVDVMLEDDEQQTAIDVAAACGNTGVLELFEKKKKNMVEGE